MAKSQKSNAKKKKTQDDLILDKGVRSEIILCLLLAVSILLFISNIGIGGVVGGAISSFFFGMLGIVSYIFPVLLFISIVFYFTNRKAGFLARKLTGGILLFILLCVLLQLIFFGYDKGTPFFDYYIIGIDTKLGGGLIGGLFTAMIAGAFGIVGAYVVVLFGAIVALIILTHKPLISQFKEKSAAVYDSARSDRRNRKKSKLNVDGLDLKKRNSDTASDITEHSEYKHESKEENNFQINRLEDLSNDESNILADEITLKPIESVVDEFDETDLIDNKNINYRSSREEIENNIAHIKNEIDSEPKKTKREYKLPPLKLLSTAGKKGGDSDQHLRETAAILQQTFHSFGVEVTVTNASCGPTVTRYELQPNQGVKVSKILNLADDIKLKLAATDIRIEAPIPGKSAVGIEVPNNEKVVVKLRELLQSEAYVKSKAKIPFAVGKDIAGNAIIVDVAKMPHLLIAGATGAGKSVCINTLIMSILYKSNPDDVKLIMIDPKVVELSVYNGIPHLLIPVVTDPKKAAGALNWAVAEMTNRYNIFADYNVRDLDSYNAKAKRMITDPDIPETDKPKLLPKIVIIVDELADLMMVAPGEAEDAICRLAQLARACGIHLIIATQRPSVNVITGLIKANMPSRIAFSVTSGVDSRTILDMNGAEKLLGNGDMLFYPQGYPKPARLQGAYVSEEEVNDVVKFITSQQNEVVYNNEIEIKINTVGQAGVSSSSSNDRDAYFVDAGKFIIEKDKASIGMLQRVFKIGFNRAARIMDQLCEAGVVGEEEGTKPRKVLMSMEQFEQVIDEML